MKTRYTVALLLLGLVLPTGEAVGQQAGPTLHRYIVRAVLTAEGHTYPSLRSIEAINLIGD